MVELPVSPLGLVSLYIISSGWLLFLAATRSRPPQPVIGAEPLYFVLVVPALNEELVIANTVRHLLRLRGDNYVVLVIDDGSDDGTAAAVEAFGAERVRLLQRRPPNARLGKGQALNNAYEAILTSELPEIYGEENIIVAVMDADGQVEPDMLDKVGPYFADPKAGAVQVGVRMLNARDNLITRWQQYEFVTFNFIFSRARESLGSGSLGGNGQFVRLSALSSLDSRPWSDNLTEDLDLGLRLMRKGWRNHYCHDAKVYQQAVRSMRRLVRQRSRWYQGHLSCWKHIPGVLASPMPAYRKADVLNYLIAPATVIPLGILSIGAAGYVVAGAFHPLLPQYLPSLSTDPVAWLKWYILGVGVAPLLGLAIWREGHESPVKALLWGHLFCLGSYIWFAAALQAAHRATQQRGGWLKTSRTAIEGAEPLPLASATTSRFLAAGREVRWSESTGVIMPLRSDNFLPRYQLARRGIPEGFQSPVTRPSRLSHHLERKRTEVYARRLELLIGEGAAGSDARRHQRHHLAETEPAAATP